MNEISKVLISLLSTAIRKDSESSQVNLKSIDWSLFYKEAKDHQVHTLLYPLIITVGEDLQPEAPLLSLWKKDTLREASYQVTHMEQIRQVLTVFHNFNIQVIALKGLILREYYPSPELRTMGDADILIQRDTLPMAEHLLTSLGYEKGYAETKHITYKHEQFPTIEVHFKLTKKESAGDFLSFTDYAWETSEESSLYQVPVRILSVECQLLYLLLHTAGHMISGGFGLRQVCDIVLFVEAHEQAIDWTVVLDKASLYKIHKFSITLLALMHKYFALSLPHFLLTLANEDHIDLLLQDILNGGVYGRRSPNRETSNRLSKYADIENTSARFAGVRHIFCFLFPPAYRLNPYYTYAKRYTYLLPFAWIHRGLRNIKKSSSLEFPLNKDIKAIGKDRAKLLRLLQLH